MSKLVLLRHGQSVWNRENRFTGWTDVELSKLGGEQAQQAGRLMKAHQVQFDIAYTSFLKRAIRTLWIALTEMDLMWIPVHKHWRLNERHYGALQGLNKDETARRVGEAQVHTWRRSFGVRPPLLTPTDDRNPVNELKYKQLAPTDIPLGESLKDTLGRLDPYLHESIWPQLHQGSHVLIVAHENSLRGLVKELEKYTEQGIVDFEIPTGQPLVYELDEQLTVLKKYYLPLN